MIVPAGLIFSLASLVISIEGTTDGGWSQWLEWSQCSVTCGRGSQKRIRICNNPPPQGGGKYCPGSPAQKSKCDPIKECPGIGDGGWSEWSDWTPCSSTCGFGSQERVRLCDNPTPAPGGRQCEGESLDERSCKDLKACSGGRKGGWSEWSEWSECSATCGVGNQERRRVCNNPAPGPADVFCEGSSLDVKACDDLGPCLVDGGWSEWSDWSECSATCGLAEQHKFRFCESPVPANGGKPCEGDSRLSRVCEDLEECAGDNDGGWSNWNDWSPCTSTCGLASQHRFRLCNNPPPSPTGKYCEGEPRDKRRCDGLPACPGDGDGGWSDWSEWSQCTSTCGAGMQNRFRLCNNPPPSLLGSYCEGNPREKRECEGLQECPDSGDEGWSEWSAWGPCSASCGLASQYRSRVCSNPRSSSNCVGRPREKRKCDHLPQCLVSGDGGWSQWTEWTPCSATCGVASQYRSRTCTNPLPSLTGKYCEGSPREKRRCDHLMECPVSGDGGWSEWTEWTQCSATCGVASQYRSRTCTNPEPSITGKYCEGSPREKRRCDHVMECSVNGGWSSWGLWTECSKTCEDGVQSRRRTCTEPEPQNGGRNCSGIAEESVICRTQIPCPINGGWSSWTPWSPCSVTCQEGRRARIRSCDNPPPSNGGRRCRGSGEQMERCQDKEHCPVNGQWSRWTPWSPCLVTCGTAVIQRFRSCDNPPPRYEGDDCVGDSTETKICQKDVVCPVHGQWSTWTPWGDCLATNCYTKVSFQYRQRSCNNPVPDHGGRMCDGEFVNSGLCGNPVNCRTDGQWGQWSEWSCLPELVKRERKCDKPAPARGGKDCPEHPIGSLEFHTVNVDEYCEICRKLAADDDGEVEGCQGSGDGPN